MIPVILRLTLIHTFSCQDGKGYGNYVVHGATYAVLSSDLELTVESYLFMLKRKEGRALRDLGPQTVPGEPAFSKQISLGLTTITASQFLVERTPKLRRNSSTPALPASRRRGVTASILSMLYFPESKHHEVAAHSPQHEEPISPPPSPPPLPSI